MSGVEEIVRTFYIKGEEGVSGYWRRNKSPIEAREMANLLQAIRKICGFIGPNVGNVIWDGMRTVSEATEIVLNPNMVMGKYPVPANKTDIVVGTVLNEALRRVEWSERVAGLVFLKVGKPTPEGNLKLKRFLDMGEQIYIDLVANRSVFGFYAEKVRMASFLKARRNFVQPPSFEELIHIWWLMAADLSGTKYQEDFSNQIFAQYGYNLESYYQSPLKLLNSIVRDLKEECPKIKSIVERCAYRSSLYCKIWDELWKTTRFWLTDITDPMLMPKVLDLDDILSEESSEALKAIKATLAREIEASFPKGNFDLTDEIRIICQNDELVVPVEVNEFVVPMEEVVDNQLVYKLFLALKKHARRKRVIYRGLNSGKIDGRRLYRAPLSDKIFCIKKETPEIARGLILLVDASGSMGGPKWRNMQKIFASLFNALKRFNKQVRVVAYYEVKGKCTLTELSSENGDLYTVFPQGKTASGEAIIATNLLLKSRVRSQFIIHLTDGASNWGSDVKYAIEHCNQREIPLITLGFGCQASNKTALKDEYGNQVEFIDTFDELPKRLSRLLCKINYL
jgi:uncharacterized protein YegL